MRRERSALRRHPLHDGDAIATRIAKDCHPTDRRDFHLVHVDGRTQLPSPGNGGVDILYVDVYQDTAGCHALLLVHGRKANARLAHSKSVMV